MARASPIFAKKKKFRVFVLNEIPIHLITFPRKTLVFIAQLALLGSQVASCQLLLSLIKFSVLESGWHMSHRGGLIAGNSSHNKMISHLYGAPGVRGGGTSFCEVPSP